MLAIDVKTTVPSFLQNQVVEDVRHYHTQWCNQVQVEDPTTRVLWAQAIAGGIVTFGAICFFAWVFAGL